MPITLRTSLLTLALLAATTLASAQTERLTVIKPQARQLSSGAGATIYVTFEGMKQGKLKGQCAVAKWVNASPAIGYSYEVTSPRDMASGLPTGTRKHSPLTITKAVGAASPQLFQAAVTNENLKSVLLQFVRLTSTGTEETYFTIKLTNANISHFRQYIADPNPASPGGPSLLEEVSFTFQKIEMTSADGGTMATDDWETHS